MKPAYLMIFLFLVGCGEQKRQYEQYNINSVQDLTLTSSNHPHGFGESQCFVCHNPSNLHRVNRIKAPNFDLANPLVKQSGIASCRGCHGSNGVSP